MAPGVFGKWMGLLLLSSLVPGGAALWGQAGAADGYLPRRHGYMRPDPATRARMDAARRRMPVACFVSPSLKADSLPSAVNLLAEVSTTGTARNQGYNGDCWVWANCAMAEVELLEQYGYRDRLSVQ